MKEKKENRPTFFLVSFSFFFRRMKRKMNRNGISETTKKMRENRDRKKKKRNAHQVPSMIGIMAGWWEKRIPFFGTKYTHINIYAQVIYPYSLYIRILYTYIKWPKKRKIGKETNDERRYIMKILFRLITRPVFRIRFHNRGEKEIYIAMLYKVQHSHLLNFIQKPLYNSARRKGEKMTKLLFLNFEV